MYSNITAYAKHSARLSQMRDAGVMKDEPRFDVKHSALRMRENSQLGA